MDSMAEKMEIFISIVLVLDNAEANDFESYCKELQQYLEQRYSDYEIIIIDQNRVPFPFAIQKKILTDVSSIRWIKLAFPVDVDVALNAGIENAIGDFVLLLQPLIDPTCLIEEMICESSTGYDVVVGVAEHPRTFGYKLARMLSNKVLQSINYHIPKNASLVRCLSRRAINTILHTGQPKHPFFIKVSSTGYPTKSFHYKLLNSDKLPKRTLWLGIKESLHLMIFNSTKPLRWISLLGVLGSFSAFVFATYSIVINILKNDVIEGWTSMVFFSSFLFMIIFIILAFLGEYIARILNENSNQQSYYISSEDTSTVMQESDRFNVLNQF